MPFKTIILVCFSFLLYACGTPNGKMKQFGNLEIYYTKEIDVSYVDALGSYFQTHQLIAADKTQSVKLTSNSEEFVLKMILNPEYDSIPAKMWKDIVFLERAIDTTVFKNLNFALEITDAYFNPLITK
ncbi:hypothetical protein [Putridiphycobacter roseus]|nr:hypothetical protein [Putridiphycobacter roseus]